MTTSGQHVALSLVTFSIWAFAGSALAQSPAVAPPPPTTATKPDSEKTIAELCEDLNVKLEQQRINFTCDEWPDIQRQQSTARVLIEGVVTTLQARVQDPKVMELLAQDYVLYSNATSPRLSGNIVRVGKGGQFADLQAADSSLRPGDLVLLGPGQFTFPNTSGGNGPTWAADVAVVGAGPDQTTLAFGQSHTLWSAVRVLIEGVNIDCQNDPLCDLRQGGAIRLRDCHISNYNSGAGGSNSIYGTDTVVLVERCAFEGRSGRASKNRMGNAFDLRGRCILYVRQSQFIDNEEILRVYFPSVFDGCVALTSDPTARLNQLSGSPILLRDSPSLGLVARIVTITPFTVATDDLPMLEFAMGKSPAPDQRSQQVAETLMLRRRLPYWIGLLHHERPEIRALAAGYLTKILGMEVSASPVENQSDTGRLADVGAALKAELEFARMINWFETNKSQLRWDDQPGRYVVQPQ